MKPLIIYHANCTDGFGAAFCAWLKFGNEAEYAPMNYGEQAEFNVAGREVYILDFSFPREVMDHIFKHAKHVVWLDHHKTAFEMWLNNYEKGDVHVCNRYGPTTPCEIVLNDSKSGALLAWEHFNETKPPLFIKLIDDRDRWQFKLPQSKAFHTAMSMRKPWTFESWKNEFAGPQDYFYDISELLNQGELLLLYQKQQVESLAKYARKCSIPAKFHPATGEACSLSILYWDCPGLAVNTSVHMSEVGHELANQSGTFGLIWYLGENGQAKVSLRSNGDYDVSAIAKQFGGGGHKNAAGFSIDVQTLLGWLK